MSSLLTSSEITAFGNILSGHFDTFSRSIIINKEPDKIISTNTSINYAGYGPESIQNDITFVPKSKTFNAVITWNDEQTTQPLTQEQTVIGVGEVRIKVEQDCRDFINQDRTLSISVDGREFNLLSYDRTQAFCGKRYYVYKLDNAN